MKKQKRKDRKKRKENSSKKQKTQLFSNQSKYPNHSTF